MKKWRLPVLVLILVVLAGFLARSAWQRHERNKREALYQSILESYTDVLKPGMRREQVEDFLHAKNDRVQQLCCDDGAYTDLIKIGNEDAPWYCGENNVYIQLQFDGSDSSPEPSDSLKKIGLLPRLEQCL